MASAATSPSATFSAVWTSEHEELLACMFYGAGFGSLALTLFSAMLASFHIRIGSSAITAD